MYGIHYYGGPGDQTPEEKQRWFKLRKPPSDPVDIGSCDECWEAVEAAELRNGVCRTCRRKAKHGD